MAQVSLGVIGIFRPWRQAGITHLLIENEALIPLLKSDQNYNNTFQPPSFEKEKLKDNSNTIPSFQPNSSDAVKVRHHQVTHTKNSVPLLPLDKWPFAWKDILSRTPKNPFILWTYEKLGYDLGGEANPDRRRLLHRLIKDLSLAKGSHAFWPLCLFPDHATSFENMQMFMSGVQHLKPNWVIFMTGITPNQLGLPNFSLFVPQICWGRYMVTTQHIDELIGNEMYYSQLLSFLKKHIQSSHTL